MQTFLPYPDFVESASVLDRQRLGKQRVEVIAPQGAAGARLRLGEPPGREDVAWARGLARRVRDGRLR